jgi:hypothetical protein
MGFSTEEIAGIKGEVLKKMNELVSKQVNPNTASSFGLSKGLPEPIPLTRGEMSGNKAQQVFENQIEEGVFGDGAGMNAMTVLRQKQREAIDANIPKLQEEVAGGNPLIGRNDMGEDVQKALDLKKTAEYDQADQLYIDARSTQPVFVNADDVTNVHTKMLEAFESDFGDLLAPTTFKFIEKFEKAGTIREMFDIRKKLSTLSNSSSDGTERGASGRIVSILDEELDKISTRILGEKWNGKVIPDNIAKWFEAIKGYKDYSNKWNNGILDVITKNRNGKFDISAESVANKIFNMSAVSWAGKPNFLRSLNELKDNLDPTDWNKIQQEGFIRLLDMGQKGKDFSGTTFLKNFEDLKRKAPKVLNILFGEDMISRITQFSKIAEKATSGAKNTSRSSSSLLNMIWMALGGQKAVLMTPVLNSAYKGIASQRGNSRINYDKSMFNPKGEPQPSSGVGLSTGFGTTREDEGDPFMDRPRL